MNFITKYFNKKLTDEDLFLNYLKVTYHFDEAKIITKDDPDFFTIIKRIASSIIYQKALYNGSSIDPHMIDSAHVEKVVNKILSECEYSIIKLSRNYVMSTDYQYALFYSNIHGYMISSEYLTDVNIFGIYPNFNVFSYGDELIKLKHYKFIKNQKKQCLIPCYSIRYPLQQDGRLVSNYYRGSIIKSSCRDLELIVEFVKIDNNITYCIKLFYGSTLLKEEKIDDIATYSSFSKDFLFPYNLPKDIINEIGIELPLKFTPEFLKLMTKDFKLTVDMMTI